MSNYVVLARKWRPAQFSDIVGQGHIVRTLMNAIQAGRIHQAYLFTGSRGIGKTSIARIFAKAVRCESSQWVTAEGAAQESEKSWLRSCDACSSCKEIISGNGVDVMEIDGASNNGVDHIRELRENAKYLPSVGGKKIYIIDEVHMLTTAAFNALLKTLEEPPAHVIFILATTEPHKIPGTILSRCQRFDFRRVTSAQIQTRLSQITQAEGIVADNGALALIGRAAEGGMRDALSLLDQVIAFSGKQVSAQSVRDSIGLIESQTVLGILAGVLGKKPLDALALVKQAYQQGHDLRVLTRSLIEYLHGAILAKVGASSTLAFEIAEDEWKELQALSSLRPLEEMEMIFQVLHHGVEWIAHASQPKVVLDILLIKCATAEALVFADQAVSGPGPGREPAASVTQVANTAPAAPHKVASSPVASPAAVPSPASAPIAAQPAVRTVPSGPKNWEGLIDYIRHTRPLLASTLEHGACLSIPTQEDNTLTVGYLTTESYFREQIQSRVYTEQLGTLAKEYFGMLVRVRVESRSVDASASPVESLAERKEREIKEREEKVRATAQSHPVIMEAKSLFGGDLGPIELTAGGPGRV